MATKSIKIAFMGPTATGKTHAARALKDKFERTNKTVGAELTVCHIATKNEPDVKVYLWDCAGAKTYEKLVQIHLQRSKSVVIFYDPYRKDGHLLAQEWIDVLQENKFDMNYVWVVRNLRDDWDYKLRDQGKKYFQEKGFRHLDILSVNRKNVEEVLAKVIQNTPLAEQPQPHPQLKNPDPEFDQQLFAKYIQMILEEETQNVEKPEAKQQVVKFVQRKFSVIQRPQPEADSNLYIKKDEVEVEKPPVQVEKLQVEVEKPPVEVLKVANEPVIEKLQAQPIRLQQPLIEKPPVAPITPVDPIAPAQPRTRPPEPKKPKNENDNSFLGVLIAIPVISLLVWGVYKYTQK